MTRDLPLETRRDRDADDHACEAPQLAGKKLVLAPILRAGVGFLDGMLDLVPSARVAHIGLYRDPRRCSRPSSITSRRRPTSRTGMVLVLDPMLATANSAIAAVDRLKERGAKDLRFVCLLAAPEGIARLPGAASGRADLDRRRSTSG